MGGLIFSLSEMSTRRYFLTREFIITLGILGLSVNGAISLYTAGLAIRFHNVIFSAL